MNVAEMLLALAVRVTVKSELLAETLAENVALVCPELTVTLPGTETAPLPLERVTGSPELPAAVSVTVQFAIPACVKLAGEQLKLLN